ncbi:tripartite tricarboxylate transporter TctB family protein [Enteractinococcus coprophilus]|uniref:Tripartite tricarboxylate transporter TctB family protein n=1 Tax=Enteractinococcus coprophilus TaxID=1027633 RepID=A0A543ANW5_9MICC|nr:tripartite tricarboxylate transporter TctB family protein [Enteractinococcus coprophilus]TQL74258.1 tripartite tricarboxylate transporter TctB family protein [Enteractinococcus coprophilus]
MTPQDTLDQRHSTGVIESDDSGAVRHSASKIRIRESLAVTLALVGGIAVLIGTNNIPLRGTGELGPRFWPALLGWGIVGLSVLLVTTNVLPARTSQDTPSPMTRYGATQLILTFGVLLAYLSLFNVITLWLITFVTVALLVLLYGFRGWKVLILFPGIIAAVLHILFVVLLRVPLG